MNFTPQTSFGRHKRKYAPGETVPTADLRAHLITAAQLCQKDDAYLPIFARLEAEIKKREHAQDMRDRVAAIAAGNITAAL